jgi:hypothetical protein
VADDDSSLRLQDVQAPARPRGGAPLRGGRRGIPLEEAATPEAADALFERYVRRQARVALQLTPAEMRTFEPRLANLQATRRRLQRERQRHLNALAAATRRGAGADTDAVRDQLAAFEAFKVSADTQLREAMAAVEDVLTVEQRARFLVFERQMERRKLELLSRARREAAE